MLAAGFAMALFTTALAVAVHTGRFGRAADATGGQPAAMEFGAAPSATSLIDSSLVESARPALPERQVAEETGGRAAGQSLAHDRRDLDPGPRPVRLGAGGIRAGAVGGNHDSDGNAGQDTLAPEASMLSGLASVGGIIGDRLPYGADARSTVDLAWAGLPGGGGNVGGDGYGADTVPFASLELTALAGAAAPLGAGHPRQLGFDSVAGEIEQVEVPEPATLGMLTLGLAGLGLARRRRCGVCPR